MLLNAEIPVRHERYSDFGKTTTIKYEIPEYQHVKLTIYSITGARVAILKNKYTIRDFHQVQWGGTNQAGNTVSKGIYIYELKAGKQRVVKKILFSK